MVTESDRLPQAIVASGFVLVAAGVALYLLGGVVVEEVKFHFIKPPKMSDIRRIAPAPVVVGACSLGEARKRKRVFARWKIITEQVSQRTMQIIRECKLTTPLRRAFLFAQMAHETDGFKTMREYGRGCVKYGRGRLAKRLGNRRGEGCKFRGRGYIQITGRHNYRQFGKAAGVDIVSNPDRALDPDISVKVSCAYWRQRRANRYADRDNLFRVSKLINGLNKRGKPNGMLSRKIYLRRSKRVFLAKRTASISCSSNHPLWCAERR